MPTSAHAGKGGPSGSFVGRPGVAALLSWCHDYPRPHPSRQHFCQPTGHHPLLAPALQLAHCPVLESGPVWGRPGTGIVHLRISVTEQTIPASLASCQTLIHAT